MIRLTALLCLILALPVYAWEDPYYALRLPLRVTAPAAGQYTLDLDAHNLTEQFSKADRFGFKADYFAHDDVKLVEVLSDGSTRPVEARFEMRLGDEQLRGGGFDNRDGWHFTSDGFAVRDGVLTTEGADRNCAFQNVQVPKRRWYQFSYRMRGRGSCAPQIVRPEEGWQPMDASWSDPYFDPTAWREDSYFVYTGDKTHWQTRDVQVRIERFTADVDDVSMRACDVRFVIDVNTPGRHDYYLYYAPREGVTPAPPTAMTDTFPDTQLQAIVTGPAERGDAPVQYRIGVSDDSADVWFAATTQKIGPDDLPPTASRDRVTFACARNESEAIQLVFRPKSGGTLEAADLTLQGPGGATLAAEVRRAHYVPIREPSRPDYIRQGRSTFTGRLPDPLPMFAPVAYQPGMENVLLWFDVAVPHNAPAGVYAGNAIIRTSTKTYNVPVELTVWDFALPDRPTCRTSLQFSRYANQFLFPFHKVETVEDKYAISRKYIAEMARYRVSAKAPAAAAVWRPDGPGHVNSIEHLKSELPWAFDDLHVTAFALGHVSGPSLPNLDEQARLEARDYYAPRAAWLKAQGYLKHSLIQIDEPRPIHFDGVRRWIDAVRSTDAGRDIKMFAFVYNADCFHDLRDVVDIMTPINNDGGTIVSPYAITIAPPAQDTWFYYTRTAHMWIDAPGIDQRLWAPQVWAFGGKGFAVWGINQWWDDTTVRDSHHQHNPWLNPQTTWGNGSLAYFYPPSPLGEQLPQRDMTVVPSLRLLLTRDGVDDFEYAVILERLIANATGDTEQAERALAAMRRPFAHPGGWTIADAYWHTARANAAAAIVALQP